MAWFLVKRILSAILTVFLIATITFFLMHAVPGGPFNTERMDAKTKAELMSKYGLDKPLLEQYGTYLGNLVKGDLGPSLKSRSARDVNTIIAEKFPVSARLGGISILLALILGLGMGTLAALKHEKAADRIVMFISTLGIAVPSFIMGAFLVVIFGVYLKIPIFDNLKSASGYVLPAFTLAFYPACFIARLTRSSLLEVLGQDYIRTARAKGLSKATVILKHAMKNAILPVVTYLGPLTAYTITGSFVVEKIFNISGLGRFFIDSINSRDYPLIMGTTIFLAILIVAMNLIVDVLYSVIDPRITLK